MTSFFVPGRPVPQPRPRVVRAGAGVRTVSNPKGSATAAFKLAVQLHAKAAGCRSAPGAVWVNLLFLLPRPQRLKSAGRAWHTGRPDLDNLVKAVLDALNGVAWADDSQVCFLECAKRVAAAGEEPGTWVRVVEAE